MYIIENGLGTQALSSIVITQSLTDNVDGLYISNLDERPLGKIRHVSVIVNFNPVLFSQRQRFSTFSGDRMKKKYNKNYV